MNNIPNLKKLKNLHIPDFHLDEFQKKIYENLHLEFFLKESRVIITPDFNFYLTGKTEDKEILEVEALTNETEFLNLLKKFIIYNLAIYSALLETNSYYIQNNEYLIISRFVHQKSDNYELKIYTINPTELPQNYKDKIYLGRDFVNIHHIKRKYLGMKNIIESLNEQSVKLKKRIREYVPREIFNEAEEEYFSEIGELIREINEIFEQQKELHQISKEKYFQDLMEYNKNFRDIKHILIDIDETLNELEDYLYELNALKASKYLIKFKKDVINYIHYILIKINGRISDYVNEIHFL